ncbi:hypothetical protein FMH17_04360 [Vibrio vulnificus]|nr:hypothetical protein [Vibrio vulnificus]
MQARVCWIVFLLSGNKREARSEKREARSEKREARSEKREARSEKREARSEKREARSEKRENFEGLARSASPFSLNSDNEIQIRNQCCLQLLAISPRSLLEERSSLAIL